MEKYIMLSALFLLITLPGTLSLQNNFYGKTCPNAEKIVQQEVAKRFGQTKTVAAALVRMHFHDCFVRGCDASLLIDSPKKDAEKDAGANASVREYAVIDQIKLKLEQACKNTVSCSDIIALATRDAVALAGGPKYSVKTGRRDGIRSNMNDVNLPTPSMTVGQAQQAFAAKKLSLNDMVVLLGSHTIGVTHCGFIRDRITNFQGTGAPDRTMNTTLLNSLRRTCSNPNTDPAIPLDQSTPLIFDNSYYQRLRQRRGVLQIDQELNEDRSTSGAVSRFASNNNLFKQSFAAAIIKMGEIEVLQGTAGQIRKSCRMVNKN